jgi:hypothetical protein
MAGETNKPHLALFLGAFGRMNKSVSFSKATP